MASSESFTAKLFGAAIFVVIAVAGFSWWKSHSFANFGSSLERQIAEKESKANHQNPPQNSHDTSSILNTEHTLLPNERCYGKDLLIDKNGTWTQGSREQAAYKCGK